MASIAGAVSSVGVPAEFVVPDLINSEYDVYTLLYYLNAKSSHDGVRDFLVHRLYRVEDADINLVLPQLLHLYMVWSPNRSAALGDFLAHLCSTSVQFTLQCLWTLKAQQAHCLNTAQHDAMGSLCLSLEMALVNQSVFGSDGRMRRRRREGNTNSNARRQARMLAQQQQTLQQLQQMQLQQQPQSQQQQPQLQRSSSQGDDGAGGGGSGGSGWQTPRSSHESSRDSSPGRAFFGGGSDGDSAPSSRSQTPKVGGSSGGGNCPTSSSNGNGGSRRGLPPPPSIGSTNSSGGGSNVDPSSAQPHTATDDDDEETCTGGSRRSVLQLPRSLSAAAVVSSTAAAIPIKSPSAASASSSSSTIPATPVVPSDADEQQQKGLEHQTASQLANGRAGESAAAASSSTGASSATQKDAASGPAASSSSSTHGLSVQPASVTVSSPPVPLTPTPLLSSPSSFACSPAHAVLLDELFGVCSKHVRSEYFNSIVKLNENLGRLSTALVKLPPGPLRTKKLRAWLAELEPNARGLYFPTFEHMSGDDSSRRDRHYRLLRFLPTEAFVLNSRDKAPFLFHFEVQYTSSTLYDSDLFLAFKPKELIVADALSMHACAACAALNQRKINDGQRLARRENRMAHAHQHGGDAAASSSLVNPNPLPTIQAAQSQAALHPTPGASSAEAHPSIIVPSATPPLPVSHSGAGQESPVLTAAANGTGSMSARASAATTAPSFSVSPQPPHSARSGGWHSGSTTAAIDTPQSRTIHSRSSSSSNLARQYSGSYSSVSASPPPPSASSPRQLVRRVPSASVSFSPSASAQFAAAAAAGGVGSAVQQLVVPVPRPVLPTVQSAFEQLSLQAFGERFSSRRRRIQATSHYYHSLKHTDVCSLIYKHGDDVRQEVMATQFIALFARAFAAAGLPLYLHPYCVLIASANSGFVETIKDAISVDSLKKNVSSHPECQGGSLSHFFHYYFALQGPEKHAEALQAYVQSMAAYSVISYLLQVKDRHNGNLMLTASGQLIHIDYGFLLSNSPGANLNFESAPFKLTAEQIEIMGGEGSEHYNYFQLLVIRGFLEARRHAHKALLLVEILAQESRMACFTAGGVEASLAALRDRFKLELSEAEAVEYAYTIIEQSSNNWRTVQYDKYQNITNGIST